MRRVLILGSWGCAGPVEPEGPLEDTSYAKRPYLEQVAVACDPTGELLRVSARTRGWHEAARLELWQDPADPTAQRGFRDLATTAFRRDETCDVMHGVYEGDEADEPGLDFKCRDPGAFTLLLRVNFEEQCAGCVLMGPEAGVSTVEGWNEEEALLTDLPGEDCPHTRAECEELWFDGEPVDVEVGEDGEVEPCAPQG